MERRLVIFGNSGSGKTTLARKLAEENNLPCLSLDLITWAEGSNRLPLEQSIKLLKEFTDSNQNWVVEGSYADLIQLVAPYSTQLYFLNPAVETCVERVIQRKWEPDKFPSKEAQQIVVEQLVSWIRQYEVRDDEFGLKRHRQIFDSFCGQKTELS